MAIDPQIVEGSWSRRQATTGGAVDIFVHENLADSLSIRAVFSETLNAGGATYAIMASGAALAITGLASERRALRDGGKFPKVGAGGARGVRDIAGRVLPAPLPGAVAPSREGLSIQAETARSRPITMLGNVLENRQPLSDPHSIPTIDSCQHHLTHLLVAIKRL